MGRNSIFKRLGFPGNIILLILILLIMLLMIASFRLITDWQSDIAFSDDRVVASSGGAGNGWPAITIGYFSFSAITAVILLFESKIGENSANRKNKVQRSRQRKNYAYSQRYNRSLMSFKTKLIIWAVIFIVLIICSIICGFKGRECLHSDGTIHIYNGRGKETAEYGVNDVNSVELKISDVTSGKNNKVWTFSILFYTGNDKFRYQYKDFSYPGMERVNSGLYGMALMKELYSDIPINIIGAENIRLVAEELEMNHRQIELLSELFDVQH